MAAIIPIYIAPHSQPHNLSGRQVYMIVEKELVNLSVFRSFYVAREWLTSDYAIYANSGRFEGKFLLGGYKTESEALEELKRLQEYLEK